MLEETAEELGLTSFNPDPKPIPEKVDEGFYEALRHENDPPIYLEVLNALIAINRKNEEKGPEAKSVKTRVRRSAVAR